MRQLLVEVFIVLVTRISRGGGECVWISYGREPSPCPASSLTFLKWLDSCTIVALSA